MKGHGREMIQLGLPAADGPLDEETAAGTSKGKLRALQGCCQYIFYFNHLLKYK